MIKGSSHFYILFIEGETDIAVSLDLAAQGPRWLLDPYADGAVPAPPAELLLLARHAIRVLMVGEERRS